MIDINFIRDNRDEFERKMLKRDPNIKLLVDEILELDERRRYNISLTQMLQHAKNEKTKLLSMLKDNTSKQYGELYKDIQDINHKLDVISNNPEEQQKLDQILYQLPNVLDDEVPIGASENENKIVATHKSINQNAPSNPDQHFKLGENLGMMDFKRAASMSGSRFVILTRQLARLERALANFMLDIHTQEFGFVEVAPPILVKENAMYNSGQLPKFAEDSFVTEEKYRLIPTAEVSLVNMVADTIVPLEALPLRLVAHTPCFRSEAGSAGKDTRGMIRMHQFNKVELVTICTPDISKGEHEYMRSASETILKRLDLTYRVMLLCSGDTGFCAEKTYDIEVWLPGQGKYREISSVSNCSDFQSRRMKARYKLGKENKLLHTLNGSGLPTGRTLVAILENYQNADGSITVPDVLVQYMGGIRRIEPHTNYI